MLNNENENDNGNNNDNMTLIIMIIIIAVIIFNIIFIIFAMVFPWYTRTNKNSSREVLTYFVDIQYPYYFYASNTAHSIKIDLSWLGTMSKFTKSWNLACIIVVPKPVKIILLVWTSYQRWWLKIEFTHLKRGKVWLC